MRSRKPAYAKACLRQSGFGGQVVEQHLVGGKVVERLVNPERAVKPQ